MILLIFSLLSVSYLWKIEFRFGRTNNGYSGKFSQILDHFNPLDKRTFQQKYFVNDTHFTKGNGPVILFINGEAPCHGIPELLTKYYGPSLSALALTLEHRYYGESVPFDGKLPVDTLKYLNTKQALEDIAYFRTWYEKEHLHGYRHKWIVVGGSYSGALSAWSRLKFPHLYVGALSSSGVVNTILDFYQFDLQLSESVSSHCASKMREGMKVMETKIEDEKTRDSVMSKFGAGAKNLRNTDFLFMLADSCIYPVQYGLPDKICSIFESESDPVTAFVRSYSEIFSVIFGSSYEDYNLESFKKEDNAPLRMWWWQKCTEVGYFQTAPKNSEKRIRSLKVDLKYFLKDVCEQAFEGVTDISRIVELTTVHYGAIESVLKDASNIFFTDGVIDPWRRASVTGTEKTKQADKKSRKRFEDWNDRYSNSIKVVTLNCSNCGHCVDLRGCPSLPPSHQKFGILRDNVDGCKGSGKEQVINVRKQILNEMREWIK